MPDPWVGVGEDLDLGGWVQRGWDNATRAFFEDEQARRAREAEENAAQAAQYQAQGWAPDQATRQAELDRQFTPDPLRWVQERAEDVRRNAPLGLMRAAAGVFEPFGTAARYATGATLAPLVSGAERYGWDPGQRLAADIPGADLPLAGGLVRAGALGAETLGTLGHTTADLLTGHLPERQVDVTGVDPWGIPLPSQQNALDPRENLQRLHALAGPAELGIDLAAGNLPFGMAANASRPFLAEQALAGLPSRGDLLPATGNALGELFRPGMGNLAAYGLPGAGALFGAADPGFLGVHRTDEEGHETSPGITERITGAALGALSGMPVGMGAAAIERRLLPRPTQTLAFADPAALISPRMTPEEENTIRSISSGRDLASWEHGQAKTPGGVIWSALYDGLLKPWWDDLAPMDRAWQYFDTTGRRELLSTQQGIDYYFANAPASPLLGALIGRAAELEDLLSPPHNLKNMASLVRGAPAVAKYALDEVKNANTRAGGLRQDEIQPFETWMSARIMRDFAEDRSVDVVDKAGMLHHIDRPGKFWGDWKDIAETLGPDEARLRLDQFLDNLQQQIEGPGGYFSGGRPGAIQRFQAIHDNLADGANTAAYRLAEAGVIDDFGYRVTQALYGRDYGQLVDPTLRVDRMARSQNIPNIGTSPAVKGQAMGHLYESETIPQFTLDNAQQTLGWRYQLAANNEAVNKLYDLYQGMLYDPALPGQSFSKAPNWMRESLSPGYTDVVEPGMRRLPFRRDGEYRELLVEQSIADMFSGANQYKQDAVIQTLRPITQFFREGVTEMAPFFYAIHGLRQFQEFVEKMPRQTLPEAMTPYLGAMYGVFTRPLAEFAARNPMHPLVAGLPGQIAARMDTVLQGANKRNLLDLFESMGGGGGSLSQDLRPGGALIEQAGENYWRLSKNPFDLPIIRTYRDAARFMTQALDEAPRAAYFGMRANQLGGTASAAFREALPEIMQQARTMTNDYSRKGDLMRLFDQFIPLLNARKEGAANSIIGVLDDPQRAATRMTGWFGLPLVAAYAANRLAYGEAYDDIPPYEKDLYFHLPYGWWTDESGRAHPLTLKIVKSPFVQVMTAPVEHLLDANYHLMADGQYLEERQRTQRPTQRMWLEQLARMSIFEGRPDAFADTQHFAMAALGLVPVGTLAAELASNEDLFTGRPIIPPERQLLPPEYQYGIGTSLLARAAGAATHVSPTVFDRFAADIFGTAGRVAIHAADEPFHLLQQAGLLTPGDPFAPQSVADLPSLQGVPPELAWRYLDTMQHEDQRPWYSQFFSRFFGTAYGGHTIRQRAHEAGLEDRHRWEATLGYQEAQQAQVAKYNRMRAELEDRAGQLTNYAYREQQSNINQQERGALDALAQEWKLKGAWTDYQERMAARQRLPGVDAENFKRSLAALPPSVSVDQLLAEYQNPPDLAQYPPGAAQQNPRLLADARSRWLQETSQKYAVDQNTILAYLGAQVLGNQLSGLPVPGADVDLLRARFRAPDDPKNPGTPLDPMATPIDQFAAAQRQVLRDTAASWGVPEAQVKEWLNARLHLPGETVGNVHAELRRAQQLERNFHDPDLYPRYSTPNGKPVGSEQDWALYDQRLDLAKNTYGVYEHRWPEGLRNLADLRRYAEAHRYMDMYQNATQDPEALRDLVAWERFYGTGRNATLDAWRNFYDNPSAKYRGARSVEQALTWDMLYKLYSTLPDGPLKDRYRPMARQVAQQARPAWTRLLDQDETTRQDLLQGPLTMSYRP